jgi:hypothetical protein
MNMKHHSKSFIMQGLGNVNADMDLQPYLDYLATFGSFNINYIIFKRKFFSFQITKKCEGKYWIFEKILFVEF